MTPRIKAFILKHIARARSRLAIRHGDVQVRVHGVSLLLPRHHALPSHVQQFPEYSTNVVRVASAVAVKYPDAPLIDVGANVGDTANFLRARLPNSILAVEGDPHWWPYLEANTASLADVTRAGVFLGAAAGLLMLRVERRAGTTSFAHDESSGVPVQVSTAQGLLQRFPTFEQARLVKTDTDGNDYAIVQSFLSSRLSHAPVFFFEHDPHLNPGGVRASEDLRIALVGRGYRRALWWDNFGRFLVAADLENRDLWESLAAYVPAPGAAYYWDVAAFSGDDTDIADSLSRSELLRPSYRSAATSRQIESVGS